LAVRKIPIKGELDSKGRGVTFSIEVMSNTEYFGFAIRDVVVHTINKEWRAGHYHTKDSDKTEIFVTVCGTAKLIWHDRPTPDKEYRWFMHPLTEAGLVYRVEPGACHKIVGLTSDPPFLTLSLNNQVYDEKHNPECEHSLTKDC